MLKVYAVSNSRSGLTDIIAVNDISEISLLLWTDIRFLRTI